MINNKEFILQNYELLGGESAHYPTNYNEIALVVDKNNSSSIETLMGYGYYFDNTDIKSVEFKDLIGKEFKILSNDLYYKYNSGEDKFTTIDLSDLTQNATYYNNDAETTKLTVTCVLRPKEDAKATILSFPIVKSPIN